MSTRPDMGYERPRDLDTVRGLLAEHGSSAKLTAGGQSLMLLLRQGLLDPAVLVDISDVGALSGIEVEDGTVTVGAATTYSALESHPVAARTGGLADAISVIAGPQVRNMGTVGGAVSHADPALDVVPVLLSLDAKVRVGSTDGTRTVPLSEFSTGYMETDLRSDELVEAILFDDGDEWASAYEKHSNVKGGWATVGAAANVRLSSDGETVEAVRVALAAVADTAVRATSVEAELAGEPAAQARVAVAAERVRDDIDPLDDLSGSASYKAALAETMTERAVVSAIERAGGA